MLCMKWTVSADGTQTFACTGETVELEALPQYEHGSCNYILGRDGQLVTVVFGRQSDDALAGVGYEVLPE